MTWLSVDLPEPLGPMIACTSPGFTVSDSPWRISRSSTRTCRFLTSSNAVIFFLCFPRPEQRRRRVSKDVAEIFPLILRDGRFARPPQDEALSNRTFEADRDQLLRLDRELHRQLLQNVLDEPVDDEADGFFLRKPALDAVEQHVLGNLRRGRLVLEGGRR